MTYDPIECIQAEHAVIFVNFGFPFCFRHLSIRARRLKVTRHAERSECGNIFFTFFIFTLLTETKAENIFSSLPFYISLSSSLALSLSLSR